MRISKPIDIKLKAGSLTNTLYIEYPYISTATKNYYPKDGDLIESRLRFKVNDNLNNFSLKIIIIASTSQNSNLILINKEISSFNENWQKIIATGNIPFNEGSLVSLKTIIEFNFLDYNKQSDVILWLDDYCLFSYRNGNCLLISKKRRSSLKIFEVGDYNYCYQCPPNKDFIKLYLENDLWWGDEDDISLIVQYLNKDFKRLPYFLPIVFNRVDLVIDRNKCHPTRRSSAFNIFLDRFCESSNRVFNNSHYPESIVLNTNSINSYRFFGYLRNRSRIKLVPQLAEKISKNFLKIL